LKQRHGKTYTEEALMARDNPAFQNAVKNAKKVELGNKLLTNGSISREAERILKNW